ncbi:hypothetical protein KM043_005372 [Ampulex compressa]|nr:hypothetical protein KM043_005372 [Ampulex compressa]
MRQVTDPQVKLANSCAVLSNFVMVVPSSRSYLSDSRVSVRSQIVLPGGPQRFAPGGTIATPSSDPNEGSPSRRQISREQLHPTSESRYLEIPRGPDEPRGPPQRYDLGSERVTNL